MLNLEDFMNIRDSKQQGWSVSAIADELHLDRKTVRKHLLDAPQPYKRENPAPCKTDPYRPFLRERWEKVPVLVRRQIPRHHNAEVLAAAQIVSRIDLLECNSDCVGVPGGRRLRMAVVAAARDIHKIASQTHPAATLAVQIQWNGSDFEATPNSGIAFAVIRLRAGGHHRHCSENHQSAGAAGQKNWVWLLWNDGPSGRI